MDDGTYYMREVEKMIGSESEWAKKKRVYRNQHKALPIGHIEDNVQTKKDDVRQEIEKDKEIDKEKDKEIDKQYKRSLLESEFDGVWNIYPKKQGKKEALEAYIRARKKGVSTVDILNGIAAYKNYINIEKIDEKYIKQGSTFFRQQAWQDDWTPKRGKVIDEQDDILDGIL